MWFLQNREVGDRKHITSHTVLFWKYKTQAVEDSHPATQKLVDLLFSTLSISQYVEVDLEKWLFIQHIDDNKICFLKEEYYLCTYDHVKNNGDVQGIAQLT